MRLDNLPLDPYRFYEVCKELLDDEAYQDEGGYRTAIGRAYYSAFHVVKRRLEELGLSFRGVRPIHSEVIRAANRKNSMIGNQLDQLFDNRKIADYNLEANVPWELANSSAKISEIVHNNVHILLR